MFFHADFEFHNENAELYDQNMVYKQKTMFYQNLMIRAISSSSRYVVVVEGFLLRHLDSFRNLQDRLGTIL